MPRNASGTYTLPSAAFVANTTIKSADVNSDFSDIATALTQSVATTGVSSMTGPLKLAAGTAAAPALTLVTDTTTGWYNSAAGAWTFVSTTNPIITIGPTAVTMTNATITNLTVTGTFSVAANRLVGEVVDYGGTAAPALWLLCYGQAISRATYASLFAIIGTAFGVGDGATTFNVPDLRGRVCVGKDNMGGVAAGRITASGSGVDGLTLGASGGLEDITLLITQIPIHNHGVTDPGHTHTYDKPSSRVSNFTSVTNYSDFSFVSTNTGSSTTGVTINNAGSGGFHNNVQPSQIVNKIIYAAV